MTRSRHRRPRGRAVDIGRQRHEVEPAGRARPASRSPRRPGRPAARRRRGRSRRCTTSGSETPVAFTRRSMMSRIVLMASPSGTRSPTCLAWYSTRKPPCRSRPSFHSRRRVSTVPGWAPMIGHAHRDEVEEDGEQAEDDDEQGGRSTHRGGLYRSRREAAVTAPAGSGSGDAAGSEALVGVRAAEQEKTQADQRQHPVGDVERGQVEQEDLGRRKRQEREPGLPSRPDPADERGRERDRADQRSRRRSARPGPWPALRGSEPPIRPANASTIATDTT